MKSLLEIYNNQNESQPIDGTPVDGGATSDPSSNFTQTYSSINPYYTRQEGIIRATNGESALTNTLKTTALDIENPEAGVEQGGTGGPNRTAISNGTKSSFMLSGDYKVLRYPTRAQEINSEYNVEDAGTLETMTLQQYTPNRTYLEVLADPSLEIEKVAGVGSNQQPGQGGVPANVDESIIPKDAAPAIKDLKNFKI